MQADRERFGHRRLAQRDAVGDDMGLAFLADEQLAKRALHMRETHRAAIETHVETMVLPALEAELARVAGEARVHRDPVADRERLALAPTASTMPAISWPSTIGSRSRTIPKPP